MGDCDSEIKWQDGYICKMMLLLYSSQMLGVVCLSFCLLQKNLMIVGIDVFHDAVLGKSRSITGFVASTNPHMTRWYSRVAIQGPQQELVDGLKLCFRAALQKYHQENGGLPERIIVYRDGVGDGMMHTVAQYEVPQMTSCFTDLFGESYQPKMAVVVVQKRISTRIFCRSPRTGLDNPPPGTVVDHTITRRGM
jgi:aubergine-like protein